MLDSTTLIKQTGEEVISDFALEQQQIPESEEELLDMVSDVVGYLIEKRLEYLMQVLYRLDVDEKLMRQAFAPDNSEPVNISLAKAIIDRQKKKILTKEEYRPAQPRDWFDF